MKLCALGLSLLGATGQNNNATERGTAASSSEPLKSSLALVGMAVPEYYFIYRALSFNISTLLLAQFAVNEQLYSYLSLTSLPMLS